MEILFQLLLFSCVILYAVISDTSVASAVHEQPFQTICSRKCRNSEDLPKDDNFPLYMCSCSPSCAIYGDCCFDSNFRNKTSWEKTDFMCLSVVGRGQFRAVSGCPVDQISDYCKAGIGHLPPVTSRVTNTTYANVFCATCNGDNENLLTWNVELRCSSDQSDDNSTSDNETFTIVYHFGQLWKFSDAKKSRSLCMFHIHYDNFSFIDSLELRYCDSERKLYDCSASWTDAEMIKICRSYEDPVYFGNKVFRNWHCAACNYMAAKYAQCIPFSMDVMLRMRLVDPSVIKFCRQRGSVLCIQYMSAMQKGRPYSFASLLNINEEACVPDRGKRCCPGEKYDFLSKRCRRVVQR